MTKKKSPAKRKVRSAPKAKPKKKRVTKRTAKAAVKKVAKKRAVRVERPSKKTKKKAAKKKTKKKGGRPSKFKPEFQEQAKQLAELGATDAQMAKFFGVTETTLNNWKKSHAKFFESLKLGKAVADDRVEKSLFQRANGYEHEEEKIHFDRWGDVCRANTIKHYPPDTTACIFWLKNRRPDDWRDKVETQHTVTPGEGGLIVPIGMDVEAWNKAAARQQAIMKSGTGGE